MHMLFHHFHTPFPSASLPESPIVSSPTIIFLKKKRVSSVPRETEVETQRPERVGGVCAQCSKLTAMAPRGRPRKRSTRLDAALDAMRNLGFEEGVVRETVKELLDIYGDDGWPFIEEYGYKELIDAILRGSETSKDENMELCFQNNPTQNEVPNVRPEDVAGSSNTASGQICSEVGDFAPEAENNIVKSPSSSTCNTAKNTDNRGGTPLANEVADYQSNQITSTQKERCSDICNSSGNPDAEMNTRSACAVSTPVVPSPRRTPLIQKDKSHDDRKMNSQSASAVHFSPPTTSQTPVDPQLVTPQSSRRRFPCYGWIDSDDEEEAVDFVYLTPVDPAKRPTQFAKNNRGTSTGQGRM